MMDCVITEGKDRYTLSYVIREAVVDKLNKLNLENNSRNQSWVIIHIFFSIQHPTSYFYWI